MGAVLASTDLELFLSSLGATLAYTYAEAAGIVNRTVADIEAAVAEGHLASAFADTTPVIPAAELRRWRDAAALAI